MEALLAIVIGGLYATGIYMLMRRSIVKLIIGLDATEPRWPQGPGP